MPDDIAIQSELDKVKAMKKDRRAKDKKAAKGLFS
jgi:hypothetical protein